MEVEDKPPSFVPMPQYALPLQPRGVEIVLWHLPESQGEGHEWGLHFPQRQTATMPASRQAEHQAVALALTRLLGHAEWHLTHNEDGKPQLHVRGASSAQAISISHARMGAEVWAAVAIWNEGDTPGGIDLALTDDARVTRVAPRVMSPQEQSKWRGCEAWAWAAKEAMFKGHGPELEFQSQALLMDGSGIPGDAAGTLRGEVRGTPWAGAWCKIRERLLLVWGS